MLLLDTTVLIDALRGRRAAQRVTALRRTGQVPWVCPINVEEVWRGVRGGEEASVARFFEGLRVVPLRQAEGERAAGWRRTFAERGVTLSQADCLVAAAAATLQARLATGNPKDFPMPGIEVEYWPVGA